MLQNTLQHNAPQCYVLILKKTNYNKPHSAQRYKATSAPKYHKVLQISNKLLVTPKCRRHPSAPQCKASQCYRPTLQCSKALHSDKKRCIYPELGGLGAPAWEQLHFVSKSWVIFCGILHQKDYEGQVTLCFEKLSHFSQNFALERDYWGQGKFCALA